MIGKLTGKIDEVFQQNAIIDVSGVGYSVSLTIPAINEISLGQEISLWIRTIARSETLELFGFLEKEELKYFDRLISISGIGPRSALAILSLAPPAVLRQAIVGEEADYLTKVSGIGKKTAQKIIMELKDKLDSQEGEDLPLSADTEAIEALQALGYSIKQAREAIMKLPKEIKTTEEKIRAALKALGNKF